MRWFKVYNLLKNEVLQLGRNRFSAIKLIGDLQVTLSLVTSFRNDHSHPIAK